MTNPEMLMATDRGLNITSKEITIAEYKPEYRSYFETLNKAWLKKFGVEPVDEYVLTQPEEAIFKDGGKILFALIGNQVIGTVALRRTAADQMELTKMAVDERYRGLGAGKLLCAAAIDEAKRSGIRQLVLFSQRVLANALDIYRKNGFTEIPVEPGKYKRADVMMKIDLR